MVKLNPHLQQLSGNYFFPDIERRVIEFHEQNPDAQLINLAINDSTKPLPPTILAALCSASQEMGEKRTFRGYGPTRGYGFLREAIAHGDYRHLGIGSDEIFISNGAKCDLANLQNLFDTDNKAAICDPAYPIFLDMNLMSGRTFSNGLHALPCNEQNGFMPQPPDVHCDVIYLISPNNPTGVALDRKTLCRWVDYALKHQSIIIYDAVYEAFIRSDHSPRSIFEIDGAKEVAIEVKSFSATASFTGLRCSYTVVPKELRVQHNGETHSLHSLWRRRVETTFGGVPYPIQKAAAAIYRPEGQREMRELVSTYSERARFLLDGLKRLGFTVYGGIDAPYLWCKTPDGMTSWQFFELLLRKTHLIVVPGSGFGQNGEGFIRMSAFSEPQSLAEGLLRLKKL